jgi:hypothetical protein
MSIGQTAANELVSNENLQKFVVGREILRAATSSASDVSGSCTTLTV